MVICLKSTINIVSLCAILVLLPAICQAQDSLKVLSVKIGSASFYNKKFDGRKTCSGERLNNDKHTAAHPYFPYGSMVRVTNLKNDKSVVVRVNDRFSPRKGHLIDITYSAALEIDMIKQGMARVRVELLDLTEKEAEEEAIVPKDTISFELPARFILIPVRPIEAKKTPLK